MSGLAFSQRWTHWRVGVLAVLGCSIGMPCAAQEATFALRAKRVYTGAGEVIEDGVILVEKGKIRSIGAKLEIPAGWRVQQHDGVVMPGLIDTAASLGGSELFENHEAASPDLKVSDGLNLWDPSFEAWMHGGVTTVHVIPPVGNLIPGQSVVVKTAGAGGLRVVRDEAGLGIGLNNGARRRDRAPTSLQGSALMLRDLFAQADTADAMRRAKSGELAVFLHVNGLDEVRVAAQLARELHWKAVVVAPTLPTEAIEFIADAKVPLLLRPLDYGSDVRVRASYGALGKTKQRLAFASLARGGGDAGLRRGAALAVRAGLDADVALGALTSGAASILGLDQRIGTLAPGRDADLLWMDGNPLDLGTRIVAVFIDGQRVDHSAGGN